MPASRATTFLLIATVLFGSGAVLGLMPALMAPMLFDAPGSTSNPGTILLFWSAFTFPVVCVVAIATAWILYTRKRVRAACWVALIPLLNLICGAGALAWLQLFNEGNLS